MAPSIPVDRQFDFRDADFTRVRKMIHARAGISLGTHKREMVYSRLARRLRALGRQDFGSYLDQLENEPDAAEWEDFVNALTTNPVSYTHLQFRMASGCDQRSRLARASANTSTISATLPSPRMVAAEMPGTLR